jgi:hypothetical protein
MTTLDARLLVALKGMDLAANTAELTLLDKMGYGDRLAGLKRFDYFRLRIQTPDSPERTVDRLRRVLDSQSTFYNRNKHAYSLDIEWEGGSRHLGVSREDVRRRWAADIRNTHKKQTDRDLDGKNSGPDVIVTSCRFGGFLVETLVEDDDPRARTSIAAKIVGGLSGDGGAVGAEVTCLNRATIWWLAIYAPDAEAATQTAREIVVTTRRGAGLLMNPNYQRAEFVAVTSLTTEP